MKQHYLKFLFISLILSSCLGAKPLSNQLNRLEPTELFSLHENRGRAQKIPVAMNLLVEDNSSIPDKIVVTKNKKTFPFYILIASYFDYDLQVKAGRSVFSSSLESFYKESLNKEITKNAIFDPIKTQSSNSEYQLKISIDTCNTEAQYIQQHIHFLYFMKYVKEASPSENFTKVTVNLVNDKGESLFNKIYVAKNRINFPTDISSNIKQLNESLIQNFGEAVSESTKEITQNIVFDLNQYFVNKSDKIGNLERTSLNKVIAEQKEELESRDRVYVDAFHKKVLDKSKAKYYFVAKPLKGSKSKLVLYRVKNKKLVGEYFSKDVSSLTKNGEYKLFYEDGDLKEKGVYKNDKQHGDVSEYYKNSKLKRRYRVENGEYYYYQVYSEEGKELLKNGTGLFSESIKGEVSDCAFEKHKMVMSRRFDSELNEALYSISPVSPEYKGGVQKFYKFIAKKMKYPSDARKFGIQGRVYVGFVVDKNGGLKRVKVLKGVSPSIDEEAVRAVKLSSGNWESGSYKGNPVSSMRIIPIIFKLN